MEWVKRDMKDFFLGFWKTGVTPDVCTKMYPWDGVTRSERGDPIPFNPNVVAHYQDQCHFTINGRGYCIVESMVGGRTLGVVLMGPKGMEKFDRYIDAEGDMILQELYGPELPKEITRGDAG